MRRILILLILIFNSILNAQVQPYHYKVEVLYEMISQKDSNNVNSKKSEIMTLLIGEKQSVYTSKRFIEMDSAVAGEVKRGNTLGPSMDFFINNGTKTTMTVFKTNTQVFYYGKAAPYMDVIYMYPENKPLMDWKIEDDTIIISGVTCQKATTIFGGRNWIAWFATSIGISDGPYKFCGLPGLIFSIYDEKKYWVMNLIELNNINKNLDLTFLNKEPIAIKSKKKFLLEKKYCMENRYQIMKAKGWNFEKPMLIQNRYKKEAQEDNNWIEMLD